MLIEKDGTKKNGVNGILLINGDTIELMEGQFFQVTETGKRIELWADKEGSLPRRIKYWNMTSVLAKVILISKD